MYVILLIQDKNTLHVCYHKADPHTQYWFCSINTLVWAISVFHLLPKPTKDAWTNINIRNGKELFKYDIQFKSKPKQNIIIKSVMLDKGGQGWWDILCCHGWIHIYVTPIQITMLLARKPLTFRYEYFSFLTPQGLHVF